MIREPSAKWISSMTPAISLRIATCSSARMVPTVANCSIKRWGVTTRVSTSRISEVSSASDPRLSPGDWSLGTSNATTATRITASQRIVFVVLVTDLLVLEGPPL